MKVDNETIAISAIVLALLLYWANRKVKTDEEVKRDDDHRKLAIILKNIETLERAYDNLPGIKNRSDDQPLEGWIQERLNHMATDLNNISTELELLPREIVDDSIRERVNILMNSVRAHLSAADNAKADEQAHASLTVTQNKVKITNNVLVHNEFDQRAQSATTVMLDARAVTVQQMLDARSFNFNQTNVEQRTLNLRNPFRTPSTSAGRDVAGVYAHLGGVSTIGSSTPSSLTRLSGDLRSNTDVLLLGANPSYNEGTMSLATEASGGSALSSNLSSASHGGRDVAGVYAPKDQFISGRSAGRGYGSRSSGGFGTEGGHLSGSLSTRALVPSCDFLSTAKSSNSSVCDQRTMNESVGGAEARKVIKGVTANVKALINVYGSQAKSKTKTPISSNFKVAPPKQSNNFDKIPGVVVETPLAPAIAATVLDTMSEGEDSLFEEGGGVSMKAVERAQELLKLSAGGARTQRSLEITQQIQALIDATEFKGPNVMVIETMIHDAEIQLANSGTQQEKETFTSNKVNWVSALNKHKRLYGRRDKPFAAKKQAKAQKSGKRLHKDIDTRGLSVTGREEKGLEGQRARRNELMRKRREKSEALTKAKAALTPGSTQAFADPELGTQRTLPSVGSDQIQKSRL